MPVLLAWPAFVGAQETGTTTNITTPAATGTPASAKTLDDMAKTVGGLGQTADKGMKQNLTNALLVGGLGIGGADIGSGMAQTKVDENWLRQIQGFEKSISCQIDGQPRVAVGAPGNAPKSSREFVDMRAEYMELAAGVREGKQALGMTPGIEAEAVFSTGTTYNAAGRMAERFDGGYSNVEDRQGEGQARVNQGLTIAAVGVAAAVLVNAATKSTTSTTTGRGTTTKPGEMTKLDLPDLQRKSLAARYCFPPKLICESDEVDCPMEIDEIKTTCEQLCNDKDSTRCSDIMINGCKLHFSITVPGKRDDCS